MRRIRFPIRGFLPASARAASWALALAILPGLPARADWPRFRGPNGGGVATDSSPVPTTMSESVPTDFSQSGLPSRSQARTPDLPKKAKTRSPSETGVWEA